MSETRAIGLEYIKIGDVAADGGMGATLAALGVTYKDSAELTQDESTVDEIFSEENDSPEEVIETLGASKIKWSIMDYTPATLVKVLGGEVTGVAPNEAWEAPVNAPGIEQSVEYKDKKSGLVVQMPRVKLTARLNWQIRKNGVALVEITGRVLKPTKAATSHIKIAPPAA